MRARLPDVYAAGVNLAWAQVYTKINVAAVRKYLANAIYKTKKIMRPWLLQGPGAIRSGRYGLHANDTTGPISSGRNSHNPLFGTPPALDGLLPMN